MLAPEFPLANAKGRRGQHGGGQSRLDEQPGPCRGGRGGPNMDNQQLQAGHRAGGGGRRETSDDPRGGRQVSRASSCDSGGAWNHGGWYGNGSRGEAGNRCAYGGGVAGSRQRNGGGVGASQPYQKRLVSSSRPNMSFWRVHLFGAHAYTFCIRCDRLQLRLDCIPHDDRRDIASRALSGALPGSTVDRPGDVMVENTGSKSVVGTKKEGGENVRSGDDAHGSGGGGSGGGCGWLQHLVMGPFEAIVRNIETVSSKVTKSESPHHVLRAWLPSVISDRDF